MGNFFKSIWLAIGKIFSPKNTNKVADLEKERSKKQINSLTHKC